MWRWGGPVEEGKRAQELARPRDGGDGGGRLRGGGRVDGGCGYVDVDDGVFSVQGEVVGLVAVGGILGDIWVGLIRALCVVVLVDVTLVVVPWFGEGCEANPARGVCAMEVG